MSSLHSISESNASDHWGDWVPDDDWGDDYTDYGDDTNKLDDSTHCSSPLVVKPLLFPECFELKEYLQNGLFSDITIRIEEKRYHLHRVILSLKSAYFQKLFATNFVEHDSREVELKTVESSIFDCIVEHMYKNNLSSNITSENMTKLLVALDYLQIEVDQMCFIRFIKGETNIDMADLFELLDFLIIHSRYPWLLSEILKYISKNLVEICRSEYFLVIPFEYLKKILLYNHPGTPINEESEHITEICAKWVSYDIANRSQHIIELVNAIKYRYSKMFFLINKNLNINCSECDNQEKYIKQKFEELLNYSVEFIPGACADFVNMVHQDSLITPKNNVDTKQQMLELLDSGDLSDISVLVDNKTFPLHRVILAWQSSYLRDMFTCEDEHLQQVELKNVDDQSFAAMLRYIYCNELNITADVNIVALMKTSELLKVEIILDVFEKYITENIAEIRNVLELYSYLCEKSPSNKARLRVEKHILENWSRITSMPDFVTMSFNTLKEILSISNLFAQEETEIIEVCAKWIAYDVQNRFPYLTSLLPSLCRSIAVNVESYNMPSKPNLSTEKYISKCLNGLLASCNPINSIKPVNVSPYCIRQPFFIASDTNHLFFYGCSDYENLYELKDSRITLPPSNSSLSLYNRPPLSASGTILNDNLFVRFDNKNFYVQNLHSKRCISLTKDYLRSSWTDHLLSCNDNLFLCHKEGEVLKYSTHVNRWFTLPAVNIASTNPESNIFASNGKSLYAINAMSLNLSHSVRFYDERCKCWYSLPDLKESKQDVPISACFSNQNLFVAYSSSAYVFNLRSKRWSEMYSDRNVRQYFFNLKPYKNQVFYVDRSKIHRYNTSKKSWQKDLIHKESTIVNISVVHSVY